MLTLHWLVKEWVGTNDVTTLDIIMGLSNHFQHLMTVKDSQIGSGNIKVDIRKQASSPWQCWQIFSDAGLQLSSDKSLFILLKDLDTWPSWCWQGP